MTRRTIVGIVLAMFLVLPVCAQTDADEEAPKVTMTADDMSAAEVAAELEEQTGVQVAVTEWTGGSLTGTLEDFALEDAIRSLGQAARLSWMRFYMLETAPPEEPYTASELLLKLNEARTAWFESLTDEQRAEMFGGMRGRRGGGEGAPAAAGEGAPAAEGEGAPAAEGEGAPAAEGEGQPAPGGDQGGRRDFNLIFDGPGGAMAPPPAPAEGEEGRDRFRRMRNIEDPLRGLLLPNRTDTITLELTDVPLAEAISQVMLKSRFIIVADQGLTGGVSLQLEDAPVSEALDAIAEASGAQWRTVYLVSEPRQLTEEEIAQREATREERREERFNEQWAEFWAMTPDERAAEIQERVQWMERMAERIAQRRAENPERAQRWQGRWQRRGERMVTRMMEYSERLTPEQRQELKPLLEAMIRMQGGG